MRLCLAIATVAIFLVTRTPAMAEPRSLNVVVFGGGLSWPVFVAEDEGLFSQHGLTVQVTETPGSVAQIEGLFAGRFDIAMTPFDNVLAYGEGQGEATLPTTPDFFAFMGGISGALRLIGAPEVGSIAGLRDRPIGVDSPATGYTLAMYAMLEREGLPPGSYTLVRAGGTTFRVQALEAGTVAATMVSSPQEIAPEEKGYRRLGDVRRTLGPYQALCGVTRRSWATANRQTLVDYIAAYVEADRWLRDPAHHDEAIAVYLRHVRGATRAAADAALRVMLASDEGFQPEAAFDPVGAQTVAAIRETYGTPRKPISDWRHYVDDSFYRAAVPRR